MRLLEDEGWAVQAGVKETHMIRSILGVLWTLAAFVLFYLTLPGLYAAMKINHQGGRRRD